MTGLLVRLSLRLLGENARLRTMNARLTGALELANVTSERLRDRCSQLQRDCDLLGLMARDRDAASGIVRDAHRIDLIESEGP